jgi:alanyl-tRNA synthetase
MSLAASEIRETFLRFFERRGHRRVASASLIPEADPTLFFTNAGMVQFKRVFLGEEARDYTTAVTSQKCVRVSGKHNDLENVGRTPRHHTFFEMLGNFSFGDYFKREAIEYAWEFLTGELGLDPAPLVATVFREDDEAYEIWREVIGLPEQKVLRMDEHENFWSMGDTGPCGPCAEIHMDYGENPRCSSEVCDPACDCGRWLEVWNLVFMQFDRQASGEMTPLPKPSIDTGTGLERLSAVVQGVRSNYDSDLFRGILERAQEISGVTRGADPDKDVSLHVVADHARAITFLVGDGVLPASEGRGYVLRRILRRAARHGVLLGVERPFLCDVADVVIDEMSGAYPELVERRAFITDRIRREEERFLGNLTRGLGLLEEQIEDLKKRGEARLAGDVVFKLYDTYGFPVDLTEDILRGHGLLHDQAGFEAAMDAQRTRARHSWTGSGDSRVDELYGRIAADLKTTFRGYETLELEAKLRALLVGGEPREVAREGDEVEIALDETPFYAESGGQVGDRGTLTTDSGRVEILDTQRPTGELVVHRGRVVEGEIRVETPARLAVDAEARAATVRNHSGTHLLHAALRKVLGPQAMQKGSLVGPDRLRFDFAHDAPLTDDEIREIEDLANAWIESDAPARVRQMSREEAAEAGAIAIFEEKYGDAVRVVSFGDFSTELCGGTHAAATGEIGLLKIVSQTGIGADGRRIEALTGLGALAHMRRQERALQRVASLLKAPATDLVPRVEKLLEELRAAEQELAALRAAQRGEVTADLTERAREVAGVRVISAEVDAASGEELHAMVDELRARLGSGVVLLAATAEGRVSLALGVTRDLTGQLRAGDLVREVAAAVGGKGGGRPDFARAGGDAPERLEEAFARLDALVAEARG